MNLLLVILSAVSIIIANKLDALDPCVLSCMLTTLPKFGCKGSDEDIVFCGCRIIDRYAIVGPIADCTDKNCNITLGQFPPSLQNTEACSNAFGPSATETPLPRYIPTFGREPPSQSPSSPASSTPIDPGTSLLSNVVTMAPTSTVLTTTDFNNTPTSTPNTTPTVSGTSPPAGAPPAGAPIRPGTSRSSRSSTSIHGLVGTVSTNTPIGGLVTDGPKPTPTGTPAPASDGPGISPAVVATIVVATVTVVGVPLWLIRCYRWREQKTKSNAEETAASVAAGKHVDSVVAGYSELFGSTEMRHEMSPDTQPNVPLPLYVNTIAEIDSNPLRKTAGVSSEELSPDDANSRTVSFSATTAVSRSEMQQAADEDEDEATMQTPEDAPKARIDAESELDMLRKRQKELEKKRHYLRQIQGIEEEEARLQQRIDELKRQSPPPED
ncbi:uncharacterized protein MAM_00995 [Metarhizium album ARSEF 1941]|uniref:Extracellular membrane protein CFEM domain-containing protein n=1 Tax=Metarhizium album (strain ARSEF 1941) TaxID=1081103 RepID=A0A0B2X6H4_METAS|nr:uncharacterized protein MAM_00995 [Metarhizium album ARSEF 1941]KHO01994.1 hypothetical protein MAM_00995 [Metarhizium album ARSEF 1941]